MISFHLINMFRVRDSTNRQINVLYRLRYVFNINEREVIYITFILAIFNYCPIVWHFYDKASMDKMEKTLERTLRSLCNNRKHSYSS